MNLDLVAEGKISVEKFFGQTYIYIPQAIGDTIGEVALRDLVLEIFKPVEKLKRHAWSIRQDEYEGVHFYGLNLPSVIIPGQDEQSNWNIPDLFAERIMEEYRKISK